MKNREFVKQKFGGFCAYSGKPLDEKWQIDHATPKEHFVWSQTEEVKEKFGVFVKSVNDEDNLLPSISIVNHYKRDKTVEQFREYMKTFHLRFAKLPKKTMIKATERRIKYMKTIAELFDIEVNKPFIGKFYFEK